MSEDHQDAADRPFLARLKRVWKSIAPTEGPGYTDQPRADIEAHRKNAQWTRVTGVGGFAAGLEAALFTGSASAMIAGLAWGGWANWHATALEKQALTWEMEIDNVS